MKDIHNYVVDGVVGIADLNNTIGHISLKQESEKHGFKPVYGVRLHVLPDESVQRTCNASWVFIAKNDAGLKELYALVGTAYENFYYIPKLKISDVQEVSQNIIVISSLPSQDADYHASGQGYPNLQMGSVPQNNRTIGIAIDQNNFPEIPDRDIYELLAGARRNGTGFSYLFEDHTYPQHIMSEEEWMIEYGKKSACQLTHDIAKEINATIPKAEMVKWEGSTDLIGKCRLHTGKITEWNAEYEERLLYEVNLITEKGYIDYFLIVADLISNAKKTMLVGPARGSSAGSLVCYLIGITEVDPIVHNLIFERFIDVNRFDLPDIDIDFPDEKRDSAIKYLKKRYGQDKVMCLANINRLKAKSAIGEFAKSLGIPSFETDAVKDAIIERSSGDARAAMCIEDTFKTTDAGKDFISKYPAMDAVKFIEGHASHTGKHAAGILVSTLPLCNYGALNGRDEVVMMDKKQAEYLDLLKIDCLGLRTLSILEGVADQIGLEYKEFYSMPLGDPATYKLLNDIRLSGVFQFEGQALQAIVKQMEVKDFNDIAAITALARPGALNSGGTARYIKYSNGEEQAEYYSDVHEQITGDTFGIVVYQEQMMEIARLIGGLSWADTSTLRRAASKSMGDEFFGKFKDKFIEGAMSKGYELDVSSQLWDDISASGSWTFNKSHAVSYGLISYWSAWCKSNYPMEFAVASLNHASSPENAVKLLRDMKVFDNIEHIPVDPDLSGVEWTHHNGKLIGGLTNIKGIGVKKAKSIIEMRNGTKKYTPSIIKSLLNPVTDFDIIFPAAHYWGGLYESPTKYRLSDRPVQISSINGRGEYTFLGCIIDRNLRDLNEHVFLTKRDGEVVEKDNLYLNFKIEDDSDVISCKINRWKFESIGRKIAETAKIGSTWYLVKGKITSDWRRIDVSEIVNLNEYFPKGLN